MLNLFADRGTPAVELGSQRHRHGVLQVSAAHLEHLVELTSLGEESLLKLAQRFHVTLEPEDQPEVESRWIDVVRGLTEVHMVIGIDVLILAFFVS